MKMKFFSDRYPQQNLDAVFWFSEKLAVVTPKDAVAKRIWIEVDIPDDKQLWPSSFTGQEVPVTNVEVQQ